MALTRQQTIEEGARAAWEANRRVFNATQLPKHPLQAWEDEPEGLRQDWRNYIEAALIAVGHIEPP